MTTQNQKGLELLFAKKAAELLEESWKIEASSDEVSWPDLVVTTKQGAFGLEVREIYFDESKKGSTKKGYENYHLKMVHALANTYYKANILSVKVDFLGDISHNDELLNAITKKAPQLTEFEQSRIEPYSGCIIYVRRLPETLSKYKRWTYISDKVGWVGKADNAIIESAIIEKAKKLSKYKVNISDVRLLLVSNRLFNSGRVQLEREIKFDNLGFDIVYYLTFPDSVWKICY